VDGNLEAWRMAISIEHELAARRVAQRARLGIIPRPRPVVRLWLAQALRRLAARLAEAPAAPVSPPHPAARPPRAPTMRGAVTRRPGRAPSPRHGFGRCTARGFRFPRREGTRQ
jgi:hypothetical protein